MPWKSRWSIDIPNCSVPSHLFPSQTGDIGNEPLIIEGEQPDYYLTLTTYRDWSKRFAVGLKKAGLEPGDRVLLFTGNTVFFAVAIMGTIMAGGVFTGANPNYVGRELAHQLKDSGAKFLIAGEANLDTALEAAKELDFPSQRLFVFDDGIATFEDRAKGAKGLKPWTSLLATPDEGGEFEWEEFTTKEQADQTAVLNYSSGTSGTPKGVEISHLNAISNSMQVNYVAALKHDFAEWRQRACGLAMLPMYHAYGQMYYSLNQPVLRIPMYLMRKFDFVKMLEWIQKYRITNLTLVPPIFVSFTKRKEVKDYDLSSLEGVTCGAVRYRSRRTNRRSYFADLFFHLSRHP